MSEISRTIEIEILRYLPEEEEQPYHVTYVVPYSDDMSVLQALAHIKDDIDGTLSFRWSCRMAICGSCGMMIDGVPRLACKTFLRDYFPRKVSLEALAHFPIERDLVIGMEDFVQKLERIHPYIIEDFPRALSAGEHIQTPEQLARFDRFSDCINCLLCYSACPQYGLNNKFLGPAATTLLHRYNQDTRDQGKDQRTPIVQAEEGVFNCTAVGYCSEVCPKDVDPANAVNINKMDSAVDYFVRFLPMQGARKRGGA